MATSVHLRSVAPATKASPNVLSRQIGVFRDDRFVRQMLDAVPAMLAVLNAQRQIIYANRALIDMLDVENATDLLGRRPGDVFDCIHSFDGDGGCGTGDNCRACGALMAIVSEHGSVEECRMTRLHDSTIQALELEVTTTPFINAGETFTVFSIVDKSAEHRRQMFERIFFHDVMNVVGSIRGFAELLELHDPPDKQKLYLRIREAAEQVIGEIDAQQMLSDAEQGRLDVKQEFCSTLDVLERLSRLYENNEASYRRNIVIDPSAENSYFLTDQSLLLRILGNMVVNALEAIGAGMDVTLISRIETGDIVFTVHNPGLIPVEVQREIFRRTYSTKGAGRGLGTYSMRLLSGLLRGSVGFRSDEKNGTEFYVRIPLNLGEGTGR